MLHTMKDSLMAVLFSCGACPSDDGQLSHPPVASRQPPGARVRGLPRRASRAPSPFLGLFPHLWMV